MKKNHRLEERRKNIPIKVKNMVEDYLKYGECPHFEGCVANNHSLTPSDCSGCDTILSFLSKKINTKIIELNKQKP